MRPGALIIAEAGVNHNGELARACELADVAKRAGADVVKFQSFITEELVTENSPVAEYQIRNAPGKPTQWELLKELELSFASQEKLKAHCDSIGIEFMSTPFDLKSLRFLVEQLSMRRIKVPSGEVTNAQLLFEVGRTRLPVILSTGMSNFSDIENALDLLCYGAVHGAAPPSFAEAKDFRLFKGSAPYLAGTHILHCVSQYPASPDELNLSVIPVMRKRYGLEIGYSDHSLGIVAPIAAVAMGASVIEKHFTVDKSLPGPDHKASLDPDELTAMIKGIREVERMRGNGEKTAMPSEQDTLRKVRRSLVALSAISPGEKLSASNMGPRRVSGPVSALSYFDLLGRETKRAYAAGEPLEEG